MKNENSVQNRSHLSVIVIAKNETLRIEACLQSVAWADEIVVLDSGSSDSTCEIARRYTSRVYDLPWRGFGLQKQAAVDMATHDWILNIDCDEQVTEELSEEIGEILALTGSPAEAYAIPRRTFLGPKEIRHCGWYPDRVIRLFNRRRARFSEDLVHERVVTDGRIGQCKGHLLHYSADGIAPLLTKLNHYSGLSARQMFERGRRCNFFDLTLRPIHAFMQTYFLRLGFLDGVEGLEISITTGLLTFTKYIKLRELEKNASSEKRKEPS